MLMGRKLNLTPALAQCILNNMTVDNGDYMYDLHSWTRHFVLVMIVLRKKWI